MFWVWSSNHHQRVGVSRRVFLTLAYWVPQIYPQGAARLVAAAALSRRRLESMGHEKVAALRALRVPGLPRFNIADATDASAKDVYFIRHGEAAHNVAPRPWGEELVDAPLTEVGRQQAAELLPQAAGVAFDVVIVSPLVRAIETATIGLAGHLERGVPFVVEELCREQLGPNLPDKRRPKHVIAAAYPALDFSAMTDDEDTLFMTEYRRQCGKQPPRRHRPPRPPARPASARPSAGRPPAWDRLGQLADMFWRACHTGLVSLHIGARSCRSSRRAPTPSCSGYTSGRSRVSPS